MELPEETARIQASQSPRQTTKTPHEPSRRPMPKHLFAGVAFNDSSSLLDSYNIDAILYNHTSIPEFTLKAKRYVLGEYLNRHTLANP